MKIKIINEIMELQNSLMELPYGIRIRNGEKILRPSWYEYSGMVDKMIGKLKELLAHLQSSVFKLSKDLIDSIHEEGIVAYTS